ncbi:head GIN domain-containing protein [Mucilaginibacter segetis]|uniref:DUF2807 domain-containing protein n=1 Tax=Mucilaginibacter segetis TaxID=2793071 RepID=A0A934PRM2_9SPHI|nr:head GIN domain-containing protein [Mucilaginibacter segetis]MBK0378150.1 DUF2807 domain-containing protein [Mucilaginibacter segetis]
MRSLTKILMVTVLVALTGYVFALAGNVKSTALNQNDTQDRHLSGFNAVSVAGSFDVYITQGSSESVKVEAPSDVIDRIITEVDGGVLKIYTKNNTHFNWGKNRKMVIYVALKDVKDISLAGSGDIFFKDGLRAPSLSLKLAGSGDITGKLDVNKLESSIAGSGDITLTGRAQNSSIRVVGSGDYTANSLTTVTAAVSIAGSGDARVNVSEKLDASVMGSGDVHYTGSVKNISTSKSGSGSISRM